MNPICSLSILKSTFGRPRQRKNHTPEKMLRRRIVPCRSGTMSCCARWTAPGWRAACSCHRPGKPTVTTLRSKRRACIRTAFASWAGSRCKGLKAARSWQRGKLSPICLESGWHLTRAKTRQWLEDGTADWFWEAAERYDVPVMAFAPAAVPKLGEIAERHPGLRMIIDHMGLNSSLRGKSLEPSVVNTDQAGAAAQRRG